MTVQQLVGASALVQAMRRDDRAAARGIGDPAERAPPSAARRTVPDPGFQAPRATGLAMWAQRALAAE